MTSLADYDVKHPLTLVERVERLGRTTGIKPSDPKCGAPTRRDESPNRGREMADQAIHFSDGSVLFCGRTCGAHLKIARLGPDDLLKLRNWLEAFLNEERADAAKQEREKCEKLAREYEGRRSGEQFDLGYQSGRMDAAFAIRTQE